MGGVATDSDALISSTGSNPRRVATPAPSRLSRPGWADRVLPEGPWWWSPWMNTISIPGHPNYSLGTGRHAPSLACSDDQRAVPGLLLVLVIAEPLVSVTCSALRGSRELDRRTHAY